MGWKLRCLAVALLVSAWAAASPAAAQGVVPRDRAELQLSFAPLVKRTAPAVVNIYARKVVRTRSVSPLFDDPLFRRFFGDAFQVPGRTEKKVQNSLGSGVILRADGVIVTNGHVIEGAEEITVVLHDRREFAATLLGQDERTDLAVLKIDTGGERVPFLEIRDSDDLDVGDLVLAIGNPFGVGQTVTSGIISGVARTNVGIADLNSFIQTDAAINPGNSGGALVSVDGRLVGINTAIFSKSGGSHGIGFAIPTNMVVSVVRAMVEGKRVVRPWLGASGQAVTAEIAASLGLPRPGGVLIGELDANGPAAKAGLKTGDVVLAINGREVDSPESLRFRVATLSVGGTARLSTLRRGKTLDLVVALIGPPEIPPREQAELSGNHPLAGATVLNMSPAVADELAIDQPKAGVYVTAIERGSAAHRLQFKPGDRIAEINGTEIDSVGGLRKVLAAGRGQWNVVVDRDGKMLRLVIR